MNDKEKIKIYEDFLHKIQLNAQVVMNHERVKKLIDNACVWSYSHRVGNGTLSEEEQRELIEDATKHLLDY